MNEVAMGHRQAVLAAAQTPATAGRTSSFAMKEVFSSPADVRSSVACYLPIAELTFAANMQTRHGFKFSRQRHCLAKGHPQQGFGRLGNGPHEIRAAPMCQLK